MSAILYYKDKTTDNLLADLDNNYTVFLDFSAWYHIMVAVDTTDGTAADRVKIYVNGVRETAFSTETNPDQNVGTAMNDGGTFYLGSSPTPDAHFDGYMAEAVVVDGSQLAATSFAVTALVASCVVPIAPATEFAILYA